MKRPDLKKDGYEIRIEEKRAGRSDFVRLTQRLWNKRSGKAETVGTVHVRREHLSPVLEELFALQCMDIIEDRKRQGLPHRLPADFDLTKEVASAPSPKACTKPQKAKK